VIEVLVTPRFLFTIRRPWDAIEQPPFWSGIDATGPGRPHSGIADFEGHTTGEHN
jgi:hypothetical protein